MDGVKTLVSDLEAFARRHPERREFVQGMMRAIDRILQDFDGEVRDGLLREAQAALDRQMHIQERARKAFDALDRLEEQQVKLARAVDDLALRPPGTTLH